MSLLVAMGWAGVLAGAVELLDRRWRVGGGGGGTGWAMLGAWFAGLLLLAGMLPVHAGLGGAGRSVWNLAILPLTVATLWVGVYAAGVEARTLWLAGGSAWRVAALAGLLNAGIGALAISQLDGPEAMIGPAITAITVGLYAATRRLLTHIPARV